MTNIDISLFLAQFWGWALLIVSLIYLLRPAVWKKEIARHVKGEDYTAFTGHFYMFLGLVTVILHNIWIADWRLAVTLIGWFMLIRGVLRLSFPDSIKKYAKGLSERKLSIISNISLVAFVILSAWLIWVSWPGF
jgi:hypothetical protein